MSKGGVEEKLQSGIFFVWIYALLSLSNNLNDADREQCEAEWDAALHCWVAAAAGSARAPAQSAERTASVLSSCWCVDSALSLSQVLTSFAVSNLCWWSCHSVQTAKNQLWFHFPLPTIAALRPSSLFPHLMLHRFKEWFWRYDCAVSKASSMFSSILLRLSLIKTISVFLVIINCFSLLWSKPKDNQQQQHIKLFSIISP